MAGKTAKKKAMRKAKIKRGRQQQRQNPKLARRRRAKRLMRVKKMRRS